MVKKIAKYSKFILCIALILSLVAPSYAALSASDGSAFVTKAEFDSALADFNARLTTFEAGINSKIDSQVTSYLDRNGIWNGKVQDLKWSRMNNSYASYVVYVPTGSVVSRYCLRENNVNQPIGFVSKSDVRVCAGQCLGTDNVVVSEISKSGLLKLDYFLLPFEASVSKSSSYNYPFGDGKILLWSNTLCEVLEVNYHTLDDAIDFVASKASSITGSNCGHCHNGSISSRTDTPWQAASAGWTDYPIRFMQHGMARESLRCDHFGATFGRLTGVGSDGYGASWPYEFGSKMFFVDKGYPLTLSYPKMLNGSYNWDLYVRSSGENFGWFIMISTPYVY